MNDAELSALLARLEAKIDAILAEKRHPKRALLSLSQAAKVLGVSRSDTLHAWLVNGTIRAVRVGKRWKVPASEIERVQREGVTAA